MYLNKYNHLIFLLLTSCFCIFYGGKLCRIFLDHFPIWRKMVDFKCVDKAVFLL